jgi:hypothetical protein
LGDKGEAIEALTRASGLAAEKDLVTIQLASGFLLAEALHRNNQPREARVEYDRACALMEGRDVRSAYINQRREETAAALTRGVSIHIGHNVSYDDAERELRKAYFSYHLTHAKSLVELSTVTGVHRPTLARWLAELDMAHLPAERGILKRRGRRPDPNKSARRR